MMRWSPLALASCLGLLAGCATPSAKVASVDSSGATSWRKVDAGGHERYALALGEVALGATLLRRVAPVYPPSLLARCAPLLQVQALLVVDAHGEVSDVRVADQARTDATQRLVVAAVRDAARQWTFSPLLKQRWAADADGTSHIVDTQTLPFSETYVFDFRCEQGRGKVSSAATTGG